METQPIMERSTFHARFSRAPWYKFPQTIIVGGAGGIGSWLTLLLARQGHDIYVYDHDRIEAENLGGQLYGIEDVGEGKAEIISRLCGQFCETDVSWEHGRFTSDSPAAPVMFSCFDNMDSRMVMFEKWEPGRLFIDGRLNAETAQMLCVYDEQTAKLWKDSWFEDAKVPDAPCTFKATSHCAAILAGLMTAAMNNWTANVYANEQRSVPFLTSIWLPTMTIA